MYNYIKDKSIKVGDIIINEVKIRPDVNDNIYRRILLAKFINGVYGFRVIKLNN